MKAGIQAVQVIEGEMDAKAMESLSSVTDDMRRMSQSRSKDRFTPTVWMTECMLLPLLYIVTLR